jgi:hypothetical protein
MIFKATKEQIAQMGINAVKASTPRHLPYNPKTIFEIKDFMPGERGLFLDYVEGRMVKLNIRAIPDNRWETHNEIDYSYQSWKGTYPSYKELAQSVGVEFQV